MNGVGPYSEGFVALTNWHLEEAKICMRKRQMSDNKLKEIRIAKKMSREELAEKAGVSLPTIYNVEKGASRPRQSTLKQLANALDCTPEDIMPAKQPGAKKKKAKPETGATSKDPAKTDVVVVHPAAETIQAKDDGAEDIPPHLFRLQSIIELTRKELNAYALLIQGYRILAEIPENKERGLRRTFEAKAEYYMRHGKSCKDFLSKVEDMIDG